MATSKTTNDQVIQGLSKLINDSSTDENEKIKYIHKRIYMNYEKKKWINVIEDVNLYQKMTKSKKLEKLKIKSEFQQFCHKSRMAFIEIADDSDIDDDERERFSLTLSAKHADDFINGRFVYEPNKKRKTSLELIEPDNRPFTQLLFISFSDIDRLYYLTKKIKYVPYFYRCDLPRITISLFCLQLFNSFIRIPRQFGEQHYQDINKLLFGVGGQHLFDRLFSLHGLDLTSSLQILIELNVRYSFMYLSYLFISSAQVLNLYDEYFCTWFDEDDLMISLIIYGSRKSDILLGQTTKEYNELYTRLIERKFKLIAKTHTYASC
ncbi:unnamed protein product [Rotaria sp. Silwood1]|nr:unnamed protein product [Rotaria sp. Silwood1]CAF1435111.1 unnamed protein product [Rotaria sp. Silwood1]